MKKRIRRERKRRLPKGVTFTYVEPPDLHSSFRTLYSGPQLIFTVDCVDELA